MLLIKPTLRWFPTPTRKNSREKISNLNYKNCYFSVDFLLSRRNQIPILEDLVASAVGLLLKPQLPFKKREKPKIFSEKMTVMTSFSGRYGCMAASHWQRLYKNIELNCFEGTNVASFLFGSCVFYIVMNYLEKLSSLRRNFKLRHLIISQDLYLLHLGFTPSRLCLSPFSLSCTICQNETSQTFHLVSLLGETASFSNVSTDRLSSASQASHSDVFSDFGKFGIWGFDLKLERHLG